MDYETADGSQFSLREIWDADGDEPCFRETLVTALVDGKPYAARSAQPMDEIDEAEVFQLLEAIPLANVFPQFPAEFLVAPPFDPAKHYLKAPQFTYDDIQPGHTFTADRFLHEAKILELLRSHAHPNVARYLGCVVREGRITHLCLQRYGASLTTHAESGISAQEYDRIIDGVSAAVQHLHTLELAHNDVNPDNVCMDANGNAVLVDFDSCERFGQRLRKGTSCFEEGGEPISDKRNDFMGLEDLEDFLDSHTTP